MTPVPNHANKTKKIGRKSWYTIAWFTREGDPHPAFEHSNFTRVYKTEKVLLEDLSYGMVHHNPHGAYAAMVWEGERSRWDCLNKVRPHFHVYENGDSTVIT